MKKTRIAIVDYGMGNLSSVHKALHKLGAEAIITNSASNLTKVDKIILPGVGAFGDAMQELRKRKLIPALKDHIARGKKFLGICLGLQLLFDASRESPGVRGLSHFPGPVIRFKTRKVKIPHMGWNCLFDIQKHPVLRGITKKDFFYFVHSYYAFANPRDILARSEHGGEIFTAVAGYDNVIATQFHPEKSQIPGLRLLNNFIRW